MNGRHVHLSLNSNFSRSILQNANLGRNESPYTLPKLPWTAGTDKQTHGKDPGHKRASTKNPTHLFASANGLPKFDMKLGKLHADFVFQ